MSQGQSPSIPGRILGGILGAAAGALLYVGCELFGAAHRMAWPGAWATTGPMKWFVLAGFVLGALGGWSFAQRLWAWVVDDLYSEATSWNGVLFVLFVLIAVVVSGVKLFTG